MCIIIDTEEQYLPTFREVAKLVRAKVKVERDEPNSTAKPGEKFEDSLERLNSPKDAIEDLETPHQWRPARPQQHQDNRNLHARGSSQAPDFTLNRTGFMNDNRHGQLREPDILGRFTQAPCE